MRGGDRADHGGHRRPRAGRGRGGLGVGAASAAASASFGSGAARVDVRAIAPAVPAAVGPGSRPSRPPSPGRPPTARQQQHPGLAFRPGGAVGRGVDARLLAILSLLSAQLPVRLVAFIGAPGAGSGVPLRGAEIGVASPSARSAVVRLLNAQQGRTGRPR